MTIDRDKLSRAFEELNGRLFEQFGKSLLTIVKGEEFLPVGTIHDKGIDGLEYAYTESKENRTVIQFSVQRDSRSKIRKTIERLNQAEVSFSKLEYVTTQDYARHKGSIGANR